MRRVGTIEGVGEGRARRRGRRTARGGVTLLEILTVLVIVGVVAAFGLPRVDYSRFRADAAARVVRGALQQAQRNAIQRQHDVLVSFDLAQNRVRIVEDLNNDGIVGQGERVTWRPLEDGARFATPPVTIGGTRSTSAIVGPRVRTVDGMPSITFHGNGSASSDVDVYVTTSRSAETDFRAVRVTQSTGRADWYRNNSAGWRRDGV